MGYIGQPPSNRIVTSSDLEDNVITSAKIADGVIIAGDLAANSVDSSELVDGSVDLSHMSSQSVDEDNLYISNAGSNGQFLSKQSGNAGGLTWATVDTSTLAPLSSPTFTGNPIAPTQSAGNNSTRISTTAYVETAIANLVDSSPSALNTLNELASALGDDANFSTTVTNSIATKSPIASPNFTGGVGVISAKDLGSGIHIKTSDSGASVSTDFDELVIESSTSAGISILAGTGEDSGIDFGDSGGSQRGRFIYAHNGDNMMFHTAGGERLRIASAGQIGIGGTNYGTDGQVMTSTGSGSAPAWEDAGVPTTAGAIGTYAAMLFNDSTTLNFGDTTSGDLRPTTWGGTTNYQGSDQAGTWRMMGHKSQTRTDLITVWLRIS